MNYIFCKTLNCPHSSNTDKLSNQLSEGKPTKPVFILFGQGICVSI